MKTISTLGNLILVFVALPLSAGQLPIGTPGSVGMSQDRLNKIDVLVQKDIKEGKLAGAVTLVARKGKVVHFKAHGYSDLESRRPMKTDTVFRLASMTKPIASVALMMLYEEGRFDLWDPISSYLPEFKNPVVMVPDRSLSGGLKMVQADREINFRDILTHTSGLPRSRGTLPNTQLYVEKVEPLRTSGASLEEVIKAYASLPLAYHPGTRWSYSRSTDVAGRLVEAISGKPFETFLDERLLEPLDMDDTRFSDEETLDRLAAVYKPSSDGLERMNLRPRTYASGSGGLRSTAADYFRFCQMTLSGGHWNGSRILSRKTVELMTSNHIGDLEFSFPGCRFGLGYLVVNDIGQSAQLGSKGVYSWGGAFGTRFWVDPEEELIGILMIQLRPYTQLETRSQFRTLVYAAIDD